ncbi:MAG: PilZ domain-containing protein [Deltaproteobacteria bacterium]|nr:PilZ domain-containing protein [Deltaproteobacteria bacterium]MCC6872681.1 PilZ domain-containing protein [Sandaracinaceae bacterium]
MEASAGRIVLVEDMPFAGAGLGRLLELYGYQVQVAGSYEAALSECRSGIAPAVLITNACAARDALGAFLDRAHAEKALSGIGVIVVARLAELEDGAFYGLGVEAAVDVNAIPEELIFRVNEALFQGRNLRRYARVFTNLPVNCTVGERSVEGRVTNVGQGGAFVQSDSKIAHGDSVRFRIRLPGAVVASGEAEVRFIVDREPMAGAMKLSGFGLEFGRMDGNSADSIARFVGEVQTELRVLLG